MEGLYFVFALSARHGRQWLIENGLNPRVGRVITRADQLRGYTFTGADVVVTLPGFDDCAFYAEIAAELEYALTVSLEQPVRKDLRVSILGEPLPDFSDPHAIEDWLRS